MLQNENREDNIHHSPAYGIQAKETFWSNLCGRVGGGGGESSTSLNTPLD